MTTTMTKATKAPRTPGDRVRARISRELTDAGIEIVSVCMGFAYARNGNQDNPTPRLTWVVTHHGRKAGIVRSLKDARGLAADIVADEKAGK